MNLYLVFVPVFLVTLLGISLISLYKIRKIHLATYSLREDVAETRRETETLFAQIQALNALERKLGLSQALPAMRGWAGSPDFLLAVADSVLERQPNCVMECSSGVSTLVVARCLQLNGKGHVYSLEHDLEYANKSRNLLERYGLRDWATVIDAPLKTIEGNSPWYDEQAIPNDLSQIEMLIVDGPPASTAPLARLPALPKLIHRMSNHFTVILDDADRKDEAEIIKKWMEQFPQLTSRYLFCEKGMVLLYS